MSTVVNIVDFCIYNDFFCFLLIYTPKIFDTGALKPVFFLFFGLFFNKNWKIQIQKSRKKTKSIELDT